jgi:hypothetical protein
MVLLPSAQEVYEAVLPDFFQVVSRVFRPETWVVARELHRVLPVALWFEDKSSWDLSDLAPVALWFEDKSSWGSSDLAPVALWFEDKSSWGSSVTAKELVMM